MCSLGRSPPYINQNPFCLCTLSDLQPLYHSLSVILYITHKALVVHREAEALLPADHTVHHGRSRIHPLERCRFREVGNHPSQLQQCGLPAQRGHCCVQASCHAILPGTEPVSWGLVRCEDCPARSIDNFNTNVTTSRPQVLISKTGWYDPD
uniref:Uncharacterized protein n=1 Tax=Physcomitrium patens TaxID=3218 RepID=A0A2K1ISN5_PHYPA|nr:hypothetical protein PHYPA_026411 [Physcomitrium patens]